MKLNIHSKAPNFKLPNQEGEIVELNKLKKMSFYFFIQKIAHQVVLWKPLVFLNTYQILQS